LSCAQTDFFAFCQPRKAHTIYGTVLKQAVAAPDHKFRQCVQRSALFPDRAVAPDSQEVGFGRGTVASLGSLGAMPQEKFQLSILKLRIFCILQREMVSSAVLACKAFD